jgi:fimbrial chaperone protein
MESPRRFASAPRGGAAVPGDGAAGQALRRGGFRFLVATALLACCPAWAGGLSVLPTRIDLGSGRAVQSVLLTNTSAQTVTVETQVLVWPEGANGQLANDIVVTPAVVTLPPNQRMRVRIGLLRASASDVERAYRLYFTELPAPAALQGAGIGVRLRVGIPVFLAATRVQPEALQWSAQQGPDGWTLEARNGGNVHTRIGRPALLRDGQTAPLDLPSPYVLARSMLRMPLGEGVVPGTRIRWLDGDDERESAVALP